MLPQVRKTKINYQKFVSIVSNNRYLGKYGQPGQGQISVCSPGQSESVRRHIPSLQGFEPPFRQSTECDRILPLAERLTRHEGLPSHSVENSEKRKNSWVGRFRGFGYGELSSGSRSKGWNSECNKGSSGLSRRLPICKTLRAVLPFKHCFEVGNIVYVVIEVFISDSAVTR